MLLQTKTWLQCQQRDHLYVFAFHVTLFVFFKKWANLGLVSVYFRPFLVTISIILIEKSLDDVHGI